MTIEDKIKHSKEKLGEKIPCSIEILSPVHVGSGVKLSEGIDFIKNSETIHIVPQAELMQYLEDNPDELERFIKGGYKLKSLSKIPVGRVYNISMGWSSEILQFERNGFGKPYIPGSSIKGAIRTILLKKIFDDLSLSEKNELLSLIENNRKEWASEPILKKIFGETSNQNLMRVLEIFDVPFDELELSKVLVLTLTSESGTSYGWKKMGRDPKTKKPFPAQKNPNYATSIFVETLPIGTKSYFSISLSNFLMSNPVAKNELGFNNPTLQNIGNLVSIINIYSKQKLEEEKIFFSNLTEPRKLNFLINEIDLLLDQLNNLLNNSSKNSVNEFIMRISWGSGWKCMTGDFIDELVKDEETNEKWIRYFREKYNRPKNSFGKENFPIFPKTRKVVFEENEPKYLTGWVKVKLFDQPSELNNEIDMHETSIENEQILIHKLASKFKTKFDKKI